MATRAPKSLADRVADELTDAKFAVANAVLEAEDALHVIVAEPAVRRALENASSVEEADATIEDILSVLRSLVRWNDASQALLGVMAKGGR